MAVGFFNHCLLEVHIEIFMNERYDIWYCFQIIHKEERVENGHRQGWNKTGWWRWVRSKIWGMLFFYFYKYLKLNLIKVFIKKWMDPTFLSLEGGTKTLLKSVAEVKLGRASPTLAPRKGGEAHPLLRKHCRWAGGADKYQHQNPVTSIKERHSAWWDPQRCAYRKKRKIWYKI